MPLIASGTEITTFKDAVDQLLDLHELDTRTGLNERRARACVLQAYRDLPSRHAWSYYYRQRLLQTVTQQTSSTVTYDHTGGAYERVLTIAAGTWPSWATYGRVIIDDVHYEVEERKSSTELTLTETSNPGADVAAGTTYAIYRNAYPLPTNFRSLCSLWDVDESRRLKIIEPSPYQSGLSINGTPATPYEAMIRSTGEYYGGLALHFGPPPDTAKTYDLLYMANPRPLALDEYSTGTVAVTNGSTTVTGTNTVFPTNCVGSVIRFSTSSAPPTSVLGGLTGGDNPFAMQGVIKTRTSATVLVLEEAATVEIPSGSAFVISDPLDIESGAMLTALMRMAECEFCLKAGRKDGPARMALANRALLEAMEADTRIENDAKGPSLYDPFTRTTADE
jgi:hypothetical protein